MRKTRFMSLLFLVWSLAFFLVPDFRQAIQSSFLGFSLTGSYAWIKWEGAIPPKTLEIAVQKAKTERDAQTLAFVAMHPPHDAQEGLDLAAEAVAIDPQRTWIYPKVISNLKSTERQDPKIRALAKRLEAWDAENAIPNFLEAEQIRAEKGDKFAPLQNLDELAKETEWRGAMQKGFASPHYDSYARTEFEMERQWLVDHKLSKPSTMLLLVSSFPLPSLLSIRAYSKLLMEKVGKESEAAGHLPEATANYWMVAHMGEKMHLNGASLIERLIGIWIQRDAYEHLIPVLTKSGQPEEAATLQYLVQQMKQNLDDQKGTDPLSQSTNYEWAALSLAFLSGLVAFFGICTFISVCYVNAKRWIRPDKKGRVYEFFTVAENYVTTLLFLACLGLYFTYFPYAQNFHHYMSASGSFHDLEPLVYNVFPFPGLTISTPAPIGNPFLPYAGYAIAGFLIAVLITFPPSWRSPKK